MRTSNTGPKVAELSRWFFRRYGGILILSILCCTEQQEVAKVREFIDHATGENAIKILKGSNRLLCNDETRKSA